MSQVASRNAAFLEEMGIGAHWTLRRAAMAQLEPASEYAEPAVSAELTANSMSVAAAPATPAAVSDDAFAAALADAVAAPQDAARESADVVTAPREVSREPAAPVAAPHESVTADVDMPAAAQSAAGIAD